MESRTGGAMYGEFAVIRIDADEGVHVWCDTADEARACAEECNKDEDGVFRAVGTRGAYWVALNEGEGLYV